MKADFYKTFEERYLQFGVSPVLHAFPPDEIIEILKLRRLIDRVTEEMGYSQSLRPDAKLFLLVNLHTMILEPVRSTVGLDVSNESFQKDVESDIRLLLEESVRLGLGGSRSSIWPGDPVSFVSSHNVIAAVNNQWRNLRMNSLSLWGDEGDSE